MRKGAGGAADGRRRYTAMRHPLKKHPLIKHPPGKDGHALFFPGETWARMKKKKLMYLFVLPFMSLFFIFTVLPVLASMALSLTQFNMLSAPRWIGFDNYVRLFLQDEYFLLAVRNTILFAVIIGPGGYLLSLLFAWIINELDDRVRMLVTLILYAPSISGNAFLIWSVFFSGDSYGYFNSILMRIGLLEAPVIWLKDVDYIIPCVIVVSLWTSLGTSFLAFIAGFKGIDRTYYEAGAVDGLRNRWQELWYITLPLMKPQLLFGSVMSITSAFGIGDMITALCGYPTTDYVAHTIMNHLQDYGGARYEMGYACAIATVLFVLMVSSNVVIKRTIAKVGT